MDRQPSPRGIDIHGDDFDYVGFWPRLFAALVDLALQLAITAPLLYVVYGRLSHPDRMFLGWGDFFISYVLPAALVIALWVKLGATPGKMLIRAEIVDAATGAPLTPRQSTIRYLGYYVSALAAGIGYLWVAFDARKQGWHDKMAGSVVIRRRN